MTLAWIKLNSNRSIQLTSLEVFPTYGGLLAGYPSARINDRLLARLARPLEDGSPPVHVITPPRSHPGTRSERPPLGPEERLPAVYCRGHFQASPIDKKRDDGFLDSFLTVVWFQDDLAAPIADFVTAAVADLAWEGLAKDYEL
ncbi:hypothetical protein [Actinomadura sp. HBU206391]|uniref:hypothetical protein n=1 Tax=Actinomadura sp. HBU206391 TaxID=2731692 RepID=UPI00164F6FFC|nr:hypothetical protein [Actinomadura sp. HBU206391]MBC6456596.1 hypothetical protein [Actinomadura sp. HBU206391]